VLFRWLEIIEKTGKMIKKPKWPKAINFIVSFKIMEALA